MPEALNNTYSIYVSECTNLVRSLVIKSTELAKSVNESVQSMYGVDVNENDPTTWRLYMNMAGQYHPTNTIMKVLSLDTLEEIDFTIENLNVHRATRKQYIEQRSYFDALVTKYPTQETLIKGILFPVAMSKIIAADDHTILTYNNSYIESQEQYLIADLQQWINAFFRRLSNSRVSIIDKLFYQARWGILYGHMINAVRNIRLKYAKTPQAHSYHIWAHLGSHMYLDEFKDYMTLKQALYFYRNIDWLLCNTGISSTFDELVDIVMSERQLPLAKFTLQQNDENVTEDLLPAVELMREQINLLDITVSTKMVRTVRHVLEQELNVARDNSVTIATDEVQIMSTMAINDVSSVPTKVLESAVVDLTDSETITLEDVLVCQWLYFSQTNRYNVVITIAHPKTGEAINIKAKDTYPLWLYAMNMYRGVTLVELPVVPATNVIRYPSPTFEQIRDITPTEFVTNEFIHTVLDQRTLAGTIVSTETFHETCQAIYKDKYTHWFMYSQFDHLDQRGYAQGACDAMYMDKNLQLGSVGQTYAEFFSLRNWDFLEMNTDEALALGTEIYSKITGSDTNDTQSLASIQKAMLSVMTRMSSYTSQYISTINSSPAVNLDRIDIRLGEFHGFGSSLKDLELPITELLDQSGFGEISHSGLLQEEVVWEYGIKGKSAQLLDPTVDFLSNTRPTFHHEIEINAGHFLDVSDSIS